MDNYFKFSDTLEVLSTLTLANEIAQKDIYVSTKNTKKGTKNIYRNSFFK